MTIEVEYFFTYLSLRIEHPAITFWQRGECLWNITVGLLCPPHKNVTMGLKTDLKVTGKTM